MSLPFRAAADGAQAVDLLFAALLALSTVVVIVLAALVLTFCIRYRAGSDAPRADRDALRSPMIEAGWIGLTLIVFLAIGVWSNIRFVRAQTPPEGAYRVYAVGKQWMWKIEHPSGRREINELHVPIGEPVRVILASDDVIHSFYIPAFRVKHDVVPGHFSSLWFTARRAGMYRLYCAEYCGAEHSRMVGRIIALPPEEFSRWLSGAPREGAGRDALPLEAAPAPGRAFTRLGCGACHTRNDRLLAPRLDGIWGRYTTLEGGRQVRVDERYLREAILDPNASIVAGYPAPSLMPTYRGVVSEEELIDLIEFIRSIRHGWPDPAPEDAL